MTASQDVQDSFDESLKLNSSSSPPSGGLKRQVGNNDAFPAPKRICPQSASDPPPNCNVPKFTGFLTAGSNREIKVSEAALSSARARLHASDEDFEEEGVASARSDVGKGSTFVGFVTAGTNKPITVSDSALEMAKRRLDNNLEDVSPSPRGAVDSENRDPSQLHVPSPPQNLMSVARISRSPRDSPLCSPLAVEKSIGGASPMPSNPPGTLTPSGRNVLATGKVVAEFPKAFRATCIRDLRSCPQDTVDFLGIVIESGAHGQNRSNVPVIKMADRYGESVQVELLSSSIPVNISTGCVISIEGAVIRRNGGAISLILNDSAFVDLEPNDPEAECLHRLFRTGLFDVAPSEDDFTFETTALRVIGRLSEYPNNVSTVMARICSINYEALVYLGCITCKRYAVRGPDGVESCQNCNSKKARYFYSLHVEVADFSGVLAVYFTDEAAEKLIGKPAGGMVKLHKDLLRTKLSPLCYRPMLFRISLQNSKWLIDDWKYLEIPRFKPFLLNIAKQKGYK
ncbi:unnamed protein product [Haemonchus placei]|uniref:Rep_fac-A_C domain-containing protein n=1 Tax=Haemonchus placei TaxID=6290 RepID=A0A158QQ75_HAEPC|nr:unnamed protein product [Haemonchus placei]